MIPAHWRPHRRTRDDELVGYLVGEGDAVVPVTVFGYPLAEPGRAAEAEGLLEADGLSVLADPWYLRLDDGETIRVRIREVDAERLTVVIDDFGAGGNLNDAFVLAVPEAGRLSR